MSEDRSFPPHPYDKDDQRYSGQQREIRHEPSNAIESAIRRRGEHEGAVGLNEKLRDRTIRVAVIHGRGELLCHRAAVRTVEVIASDQRLIATTHANELAAETIYPGVVAGAEKEEHG